MDPINDTAGTNIASESNTEDNSHNINDGEMTDSDKNAVGAIDTAVSKSNADEGTQIENVLEVTGATHLDAINDTAGTNIASESNTEDNSHNINDGEMTDSDKNAVGAIDTAVSKSNADEGTQIENVSEVTGATHLDAINDTAGTNIASESNTEDNSHNINDGEMTDPDKNAVGAIDTAVSKSNADEGTQIENVSEVTGATHNGETTEPLDDDDCSMGFCDWISIGLIVFFLGLYIADVVTDIDLAVEYSNKGLANYFWATLACIIIPHLLVAFTDFCMLWEDRKNIMAHMKKQTEDESIKQGGEENVEMITLSDGNEPEVKSQSPESTGSTHSNGGNGPRRASLKACIPFDFTTKTECFCFRGILCLFLGIIIRKFECIYYTIKVKKERNVQLRQWYNCKLLEATRDSTNLGFICAFTGDVFQSLLQLHIFVQNPVPIHERIGRSIITSVIAIPLSYAFYYRATRRQPKDEGSELRKDLHHGAFMVYYLGLIGAIIVRTLSIGLFMGTVSVPCTFIALSSHLICQCMFIHWYQKPPFSGFAISENLCLRRVSVFIQTFFYALVNVFLFVDLNDRTRKRWRIVTNNLILYIESVTFLTWSLTCGINEYSNIYISVAVVGCIMHLACLSFYYKYLHPSADTRFTCVEGPDEEVA